MFGTLLPALRLTLLTCLICGLIYPLVVTALGQWLAPFQANGSLLHAANGTIIGSRLIGQNFNGPEWFHGRPSATNAADPNDPSKTVPAPYNAANSAGSNLGPTSKILAERLAADRKALHSAQPELSATLLPSDMITASASGLDPDISLANALLQAPRVAEARGLSQDLVRALLERHTKRRALALFGEPRVNVLELNIDLQKASMPRSDER